jgi:starch phosphorylase
MGTELPVRATVQLGAIDPDEVLVECHHGLVDATGYIVDGSTVALAAVETGEDGVVRFAGSIPCSSAGRWGYTVRVVPRKEGYPLDRFETGLIAWWEDPAGAAEDAPGKHGITVHRA